MHTAPSRPGLVAASLVALAAASLGLLGCAAEDDPAHDHDGHDHGDHGGVVMAVAATHRAVADGAWGAATTWDRGVPPAGATVHIPAGRTVTVAAVEPARLRSVLVEGELRFGRAASTELRVETVEVAPSGRLVMGEAGAPIPAGFTARLIFLDDGTDIGPIAGDRTSERRGLIGLGAVVLRGAERTAFVPAQGSLRRGQTSATLRQAPTGWRVGDTVLVPSTRFDRAAPLENETRTLTAIAGATISWSTPLQFDHEIDPSMAVHVANLTRNVVLASESKRVGRRGHVMLMDCARSAIDNAAFVDLGRTDKRRVLDDARWSAGALVAGTGGNQRGRYPLHVHECGLDGPELRVSGAVVVGSPGWGMVNHGSRVAFVDDVVYDFTGAGFVAEDGVELGRVVRSLAAGGVGDGTFSLRRTYIDVRSRMDAADFAFHGDGFWFHSPMVEVRDNVAAGNKGVGFFYHSLGANADGAVGFPEGKLPRAAYRRSADHVIRRWSYAADALLVVDLPLHHFSGNAAYGNFIGLKLRYLQSTNPVAFNQLGLTDQIVGATATVTYLPFEVTDSSFWNNSVGVHNSYTTGPVFRRLTIATNKVQPVSTSIEDVWVGWEGWHGSASQMKLLDSTIKGYPIGMLVSPRVENKPPVTGTTFVGIPVDRRQVEFDDRDLRM